MKQICALMLLVLAGVVMAADAPMTLTKKNIAGWGSPKYFQTPPVVTVENTSVKVLGGKTVPGAKVSKYQLGILRREPLKAGVTYTLTFTLKSNMAVKNDAALFQLSGAPYKAFASVPVNLNANEAKTFKMTVTPKEDITAMTRIPGTHIRLQEGQIFEISNVILTESTK